MRSDGDNEQITEAWANRAYLVNLAFRMLNDIGEAEDIVQEAFSRLLRAKPDAIEDERGWLIVVTSRMCLDHIRSARSRHQRPYAMGADEADILGLDPRAVDPADRVTLDDNVRLALLVVLKRLSPAERVVYVLHDIFQLPFGTVATTVGRTVPACRQLARRARLKVGEQNEAARFDVGASEHMLVTQKFIAACANGDLDGLLAVLHPKAWGVIDIRPHIVISGATEVARNLLRYWGGRGTLVSQPVGGQSTILAFVDRRLEAVFLLSIDHDRITKLQGIADPQKVSFLQGQLTFRQ